MLAEWTGLMGFTYRASDLRVGDVVELVWGEEGSEVVEPTAEERASYFDPERDVILRNWSGARKPVRVDEMVKRVWRPHPGEAYTGAPELVVPSGVFG